MKQFFIKITLSSLFGLRSDCVDTQVMDIVNMCIVRFIYIMIQIVKKRILSLPIKNKAIYSNVFRKPFM